MIYFIVFSIVVLTVSLIILARELYMLIQWRKLSIETEKIYRENLSGNELIFELEYLTEQENVLKEKQNKLFPYLNSKRRFNYEIGN